MTVFKFLFTAYAQYYIYMRKSQVTSSHFSKYFCDTYFKYITPCTEMTDATYDAIWATPPWLHTLRSHATVWSGWVGNATNGSQEEIG
jgi:hypothetical protein